MGDAIISPKRKDLVERLRRRIDLYRRAQNGHLSRYQPNINGLHDQERRETLLLHQRWLESKAKKASKHTKSKDHTHDNKSSQSRTKRKSETAGDITNNNIPDGVAPPSPPANKKSRPSTNHHKDDRDLPRVSVQIVQQINQQKEQTQTIQTNVTFSSTIKTNTQGGVRGSDSSVISGNGNVLTNVECKQEPIEDVQSSSSSHTSDSLTNLGVDIEELQAILDNLEKEGEITDFDKFNDALNSLGKEADELELKDSLLCNNSVSIVGSTNIGTVTSPGVPSNVNNMSKASKLTPNQSLYNNTDIQNRTSQAPIMQSRVQNTGMPTGGLPPGYQQHSHPIIPSVHINETGPAAETLKLMAAQHQQHEDYDPLQKIQPFQYSRSELYSGYGGYVGQEQAYPYTQPTGSRHMNSFQPRAANAMRMNNKDPSMNYGATKPLTHYNEPNGPMSSSLQQLQNQVHSHFNNHSGLPAVQTGIRMPPVELSQSQQVHMSTQGQGVQRMHMQQTQQMHISGHTQHISLAQQQTFSVTQGQQNYMRPPEPMIDRRQSHNPYVTRGAPPDYKVAMSNQNTYHHNTSNVNGNPLRPMQNMVNQTPPPIQTNNMYHVRPKTEQSLSRNVHAPPPLYNMNQMTNQNAVNVPIAHHAVKSEQDQFTSALMRNQRVPNVNIGPDGLNISRQRTPHSDWPQSKGFLADQLAQDAATGLMNQQHGNNNMYTNYRQQQPTSSSSHIQMHQRQTIQANVAPGNQQMNQHQHHVMMRMQQQQQIQLTQQQTGQANSVAMTTTSHSSNNTSHPSTDLPGLDFFSNAAPSTNPTDFFDGANPSDFNLIDELLAGK